MKGEDTVDVTVKQPDESLEDVIAEYKMPAEESHKIGEEIQNIWLNGKHPVENPTIYISLGAPGSGKTGLDGYSSLQFTDGNVVIINGDEIKTFQPRIDELAEKYPEYYTRVASHITNDWTKELFERALKENYNIVFELTGRNTAILDTIRSKMGNYKVIVRALAVSDLNCLVSILERYEYQVEQKGWGRLVIKEQFDNAYKGFPETVDIIEKSGAADSVEIFARGEKPESPTMIYSSKKTGAYMNAKQAIFSERKQDIQKTIKSCEGRINKLKNTISIKEDTCEEESEILRCIEELYRRACQDQNLEK